MASSPTDSFRRQIERELQVGNATEHTHRPALKTFLESLISAVTATNEPKRVKCGAPDFVISRNAPHGPMTVGYVEAKDVGKNLNEIEGSDQIKRYLSALPNLVLTDYLEFRWYVDGKRRQSGRLADLSKKGKLSAQMDGAKAVIDLLKAFLSHEGVPINTPKELALRMAQLTHLIRDIIVASFEKKSATVSLQDLHKAFEKALIPDLPIPQFADMFAQTLAYGLFAARCNHRGPKGSFKRLGAASEIPKTNPFLRKLFETITGTELDEEPFVGFVDDLAQLLADTDIEAVLADFGKRTAREDPIVHFYETFLAAYDPRLREKRGVYYTPVPVVSYIVRSVDHLLKTRFSCPDGLANTATIEYEREEENSKKPKKVKATSPRVLILDPACGTGTFLYTVIDHIRAEFVKQGNAGMWSGYVRNHVLPRIFGFELLMAPYAVAHFKLGMQLAGQDMAPAQRKKWAYDFSGDERLGVFLTNTLEEAERRAETLFGPLRVITEEANAAATLKRDLPILAVIGNPPYSGHSANRSFVERVVQLGESYTVAVGGPLAEQQVLKTRVAKREMVVRERTFIGQLIQDYYSVDGQPLGEKTAKWLQDDYVKFIRWGQWRIERTGAGILAFITNHGYLDNPTFRGMRQSLMNAFTEIFVLDLHGNTKKKERAPDGSPDKNVFDIQQGVTLGIFVKERNKTGPANVFHTDLWGLRESKYKYLFEKDVEKTLWTEIFPKAPVYLFVGQDTNLSAEYQRGWKITEVFPLHGAGMTTARDHVVIDFDEKPLLERATLFRDSKASDADLCRELAIPEKKGWKIKNARRLIQTETDLQKHIKPVLYRPFDKRLIFYHDSLVWRTVKQVMGHMIHGKNMGLLATRQTRDKWDVLATRTPVGHKSLSAYDITSLFPLFLFGNENKIQRDLYPSGTAKANLEPGFLAEIGKRFGLSLAPGNSGDLKETFGAEDVFNYIYAVFYSPTYRSRYAEFLKSDFPRVPLTSDTKLFRVLCAKGAELVAMHLLESPKLEKSITRYPVKGSNLVEKGFPKYLAPGEPEPKKKKPIKKGRVYINKGEPQPKTEAQYFEGVPPEVWNFHIGGYQVCEKWLKDRRGRTLSYVDLDHYSKIVTAIK